MAPALEALKLRPDQLARLLEAVDCFLAAAGKAPSPWSEEDKAEAQRRAEKWLERIRKRRAAKESAAGLQEKDRPAGREPVAPEQFTAAERVDLFADLSAEVQEEMDQAVARLIAGEISPAEFQLDMERAIWINARAAFVAGKVALGGEPTLSREDERELQRWGNFQVNRLRKFVAAIKAGSLSDAQVAARARLYAGALNAPYNTGQARALGDIRLPQVPGDGKTQCKTNCRCRLRFEVTATPDGKTIVKVFWELDPQGREHCEDCVALAAKKPCFEVEV
jgi:hypothetical protein